ncbi:Disease resistance protein rga2 [Thalictrum thalictroides]|uniref:Disease resistance protein rga2 n=1 Tax=Thalictrum thalictroides TaxID=46969 RepID=A0A7J6VBT2_THATH|nr:Disease resistance protein rga2 [Thalictrum thalictroides]
MVYWLLSSFVSATLQVLLEKLTDFGIKTYESISDVDEKLQKLRRTLMSVESSIRDAEENPKMNMAWQVLLLDLEKVAYDADDLIDEIVYKVSKLEDGKAKNKNQVNKLLLSLYKHTSAAPNMNDIQAKLDGMLRELESLCVRERSNGRHLEKVASKLQTSSLIDESHVYGRETDKMNIVNMLVASEESSRAKSVSIIPIVEPYDVKCLSDQACFSLLMEEAVGDINLRTTSPELEEIGMQIAIKCKGLPLAAKIVGSLLQSKVDHNEWNNILDSRIWQSSVIKNEIIPALKSGYHHLPSHVRQCFAYCSMFPQSYDFEKIKLVRMWMGEGFVIPDKERTMIEKIGNDYFDQLSQKSFFQMEGGRYMIHDAVHNLSQAISCDKFFRMEEVDDSIVNSNTRHLSIACENIHTVASEVAYRCKGLRTFLLLGAYKTPIKEVHFALFMELRSLRVLDLSGTQLEELAESIGNLKHLRFLDLSNTLLKWLPETMQELCLLQTLRLRNCLELLYLPKNISGLKSLQHLELDGNYHLTSMPSGIGKLTGLQTVSEFIVGPGNGQMKELKHINNIRGSLRIKQLEKVKNPQDALEANLANKKYLDKLELQWTCTVDRRTDEHVLDKLIEFPLKSLKELILTRYGGRMFPKWVCDPLFSQLTAICFDECKNCGLLPPLGQLPKLKSLKIVGMHELTKVDQVFQNLETLELRDIPKLESWVGVSDNGMSFLRELTIVDCRQMRTLPSLHYFQSLEKMEFESCPLLPSLSEKRLSNSSKSLIIRKCVMLKEQEVGSKDWMKIEHIPYIEINYKIVQA